MLLSCWLALKLVQCKKYLSNCLCVWRFPKQIFYKNNFVDTTVFIFGLVWIGLIIFTKFVSQFFRGGTAFAKNQ